MDVNNREKANRLAQETSPYLLQHAHNPIDWYPWSEEALQCAKDQNKPIFLSIGYSACHWCHVMAHESFEDPAIAELMNAHFVAIKVDREERPDLDDVYMAATVAQCGSGGWPMSVFLTPDLEPFYTGTYFPPTDRYGKPGFGRLLRALSDAWENSEASLRETAANMRDYLAEISVPAQDANASINESLLNRASESLKQRFDEVHGGWGNAPKFPSSASICFLLHEHHRTANPELKQMAVHTLDCMANGGIMDHIGGGFHRYSVDEVWLVPHFEKMLYDNAQLAVAYAEAYQATGVPRYRETAERTLNYLLRDMRHPEGAFYSAEDADSEGEEGKFYLWRKSEIDTLLGEEAAAFGQYYNILEVGNFHSHETYHGGMNIPHLSNYNGELEQKFAPLRGLLFKEREQRVRPGLDDKILCSWNALTISAFAKAARIFSNLEYRVAAEEAAAFIRKYLYINGALLRTHRNGKSHVPAYLDDYAFLSNALVDLYECSYNPSHLAWAEELCENLIEQFWDEEQSCFYFSGSEHKNLIIRPRPAQDGAEPAASSVVALVLLRLSRHLDKAEWRSLAERAISANIQLARQYPQAAINLLLAVSELLHPGPEIVLVAETVTPESIAMQACINSFFLPNALFAGRIEAENNSNMHPVLAGRNTQNGMPTVYVCHHQQCSPPISNISALETALRQAGRGTP